MNYNSPPRFPYILFIKIESRSADRYKKSLKDFLEDILKILSFRLSIKLKILVIKIFTVIYLRVVT